MQPIDQSNIEFQFLREVEDSDNTDVLGNSF